MIEGRSVASGQADEKQIIKCNRLQCSPIWRESFCFTEVAARRRRLNQLLGVTY